MIGNLVPNLELAEPPVRTWTSFPQNNKTYRNHRPGGEVIEPARHLRIRVDALSHQAIEGYPRISTGTGRFRTEKMRHPNHLEKTVDLCPGSHASTKEWAQLQNRNVEAVMNHSMHSADRATHLKVVTVGFLCAFFVLIVGLSAHVDQIDSGTAHLVKAGGSTILSGQLPAIR
jgi:hypothetical protein